MVAVAKPYVFSGSGSEATFRKIFAAAAADAQTAADTLQQVSEFTHGTCLLVLICDVVCW